MSPPEFFKFRGCVDLPLGRSPLLLRSTTFASPEGRAQTRGFEGTSEQLALPLVLHLVPSVGTDGSSQIFSAIPVFSRVDPGWVGQRIGRVKECVGFGGAYPHESSSTKRSERSEFRLTALDAAFLVIASDDRGRCPAAASFREYRTQKGHHIKWGSIP